MMLNHILAGLHVNTRQLSLNNFCSTIHNLSQHYTVKEWTAGIYRVEGLLFPLQILVTEKLNKHLHPIMIFGLLGCPAMGVQGAAWATVIGQIVSFALALIFHIKYNTNISKKLSYIKPSAQIIKEIYFIGIPAMIAQALMSVMTYGFNIILGSISETMVTAYGLYYKIQQFILFAAFGLRDAITPIVSFNYGMKAPKRIKAGIQYGMIDTLILMAAGTILVELFAVPFSSGFDLSGETEALFINAMRIISVSFLFAGANIAFQGIFQALEGGIESLIISLLRQMVFIFPIAILFTNIAKQAKGMEWLIWTAFPITELLSLIVAVLLFKRIYHNKVIKSGKHTGTLSA